MRTVLLLAVAAALAVSAGASALLGAPSAGAGPGSGGHPTTVAPVGGELLRDFDPPDEPWGAGHRGVSLAAAPGEVVVAARAGVVAFAGEVAGAGWVTVDHGGGLDTTYGVLDPRLVEGGQRLEAGAPVGLLAEEATHLHWGARLDGEYLHPLSLLAPWRVRLVPG
ncbi:MAG: peptidoglycan DD-metalloendopeptidase family protein [Actinomycetota bacterium]